MARVLSVGRKSCARFFFFFFIFYYRRAQTIEKRHRTARLTRSAWTVSTKNRIVFGFPLSRPGAVYESENREFFSSPTHIYLSGRFSKIRASEKKNKKSRTISTRLTALAAAASVYALYRVATGRAREAGQCAHTVRGRRTFLFCSESTGDNR